MKLKPFVFPVLYTTLILLLVVGLYFTTRQMESDVGSGLEDITYVSSIILGDIVPVVSSSSTITNPYIGEGIEIARYFYNIDDDIDKQKESLIYYNGTYMPNSGMDYKSATSFEVVAVLDGTVIDIKEDELLGKTIEIRHNNELVTVYAGLTDICVQKGEVISQGTKIGMSGTSKINESIGNHVHFEVYQNGINIDPQKVIGKKIGDF